jgi:group I intron endonuclease
MDLKISGIYKISNLSNGKVYIGQGKNIHKRWIEHKWELNNHKHHNSYFQRSWDKYGKDNFSIEVIEKCQLEDLNDRETYWIRFHKSNIREYGYNANDGGDSRKMNEETKEKIRISNTGKVRSQETCDLIGEIHRGRKTSDETKNKIRMAKLGTKQSKETIDKRVNSRKGFSPSKETREKMSIIMTGKKRTSEQVAKMIGKQVSDETREKQSKARLGKEPWNKGKTGVYSEERLEKMKNYPSRKGEDVGNSILKEHQIREMMVLFECKELSRQEIADKYGISLSTVKDIKSGRSWNHITGYKNKKERDEVS